jgi:hypothetical protein
MIERELRLPRGRGGLADVSFATNVGFAPIVLKNSAVEAERDH